MDDMEGLETKLDDFGITKQNVGNKIVIYSIDSDVAMQHLDMNQYSKSVIRILEKEYGIEKEMPKQVHIHVLNRNPYVIDRFYDSVNQAVKELESVQFPRLNSDEGILKPFMKWVGTTMLTFLAYRTVTNYMMVETSEIMDVAIVAAGMALGLAGDPLRDKKEIPKRDYQHIGNLILGNKKYYEDIWCQ